MAFRISDCFVKNYGTSEGAGEKRGAGKALRINKIKFGGIEAHALAVIQ